jgi:hypothetical protein
LVLVLMLVLTLTGECGGGVHRRGPSIPTKQFCNGVEEKEPRLFVCGCRGSSVTKHFPMSQILPITWCFNTT